MEFSPEGRQDKNYAAKITTRPDLPHLFTNPCEPACYTTAPGKSGNRKDLAKSFSLIGLASRGEIHYVKPRGARLERDWTVCREALPRIILALYFLKLYQIGSVRHCKLIFLVRPK